MENDSAIQHAMPQLPEGYMPDVATVRVICDTLRDMEKSVQVVQIVGGPGQGTSTEDPIMLTRGMTCI